MGRMRSTKNLVASRLKASASVVENKLGVSRFSLGGVGGGGRRGDGGRGDGGRGDGGRWGGRRGGGLKHI